MQNLRQENTDVTST